MAKDPGFRQDLGSPCYVGWLPLVHLSVPFLHGASDGQV